VLEDRARQANSTRLGYLLKTRGHVHAVAENIALFYDDIAKVHADAKLQGLCRIP
jgi:hypothetical protein